MTSSKTKCGARINAPTKWLNPLAQKSCIRWNKHTGYCRNSVLEWDQYDRSYPQAAWRRGDAARKDVL